MGGATGLPWSALSKYFSSFQIVSKAFSEMTDYSGIIVATISMHYVVNIWA